MKQAHVEHYKDGSVKGRGQLLDGQMDGYWEWFRKSGTKMRSGHFEAGQPVGEWITYNQQGQVYKVTHK
ncbi:MAG TPA: hypothetical protein VGH44_03335 [Candidatus Saccharimonadia bacterium]|jgi:antitoxin component YwqK of YwqJK toxin-antitoxin module